MQNERRTTTTRRDFLGAAAALTGASIGAACDGTHLFAADPLASAPGVTSPDAARRPLRLAAINSIYRLRSHAYHIVDRFMLGYRRNGFHHQPAARVVRMFNDQSPADDLSHSRGKKLGIELCDSVEAALGGPDKLDVDGVLVIIEHGDYPLNEFEQILYPRFEMFEKVVEVFRRAGRAVPVFVDKHLSYDHRKAAKMVEWSRELKFGLMAGSSLPVTWRRPEIEPPLGTPFTEGVCTFGFDRAAAEVYHFHALEVLQCMLERRPGGETGVKSVECLAGDAVWKAADAGRFSWKLVEAAVARCDSNNIGAIRQNVRNPQAILIEYRDGTKGTVINLIEQVSEFGFAGFVKGQPEPLSTCFYLPAPPGARFFDPLCWNIERLMTSGRSPYPVERTQWTSTVLDLAMRSLQDAGRPRTDAALDIRYAAPESTGFFRGGVRDAE